MDEAAARPSVSVPAANTSTAQASRALATTNVDSGRVVQPKPQALPSRSGPSSILVSPRQKGNPILNGVRNVAWEYSDIPADYVLGATTCALFLSLKYHRLHPEYVYNRIKDLKGQYNLRILLTMVDIENHEEPLRELFKTSIINNVTVMLCWSAQEAGRYLELFKAFEHAAPTSIRAQQTTSYADRVVEFITVPRSINKTDAVGLVSNFGSIRTAVNAGPEEIGLIAGWGEKKVQRFCNAVREPFRIQKAAKRGVSREDSRVTLSRGITRSEGEDGESQDADSIAAAHSGIGSVPVLAPVPAHIKAADTNTRPLRRIVDDSYPRAEPYEDEDMEPTRLQSTITRTTNVATSKESQQTSAERPTKRKADEDELSEGVMAALSKLRQQ